MGITDELRKWKGNIQTCLAPEVVLQLRCELNDIADRIDMEHQKAIRELNNLADASVLLPVDADGEIIHVGDVLDGYGKTIEVVEMRHGRSGWVLISRDGNGYADTFAFAHHHEPTVEDVLQALTDEVWNRCCEGATASDSGIDELVAECAAKLRLAGENA